MVTGETLTVSRTVTNVGPAGTVTYRARVRRPAGVAVEVVPQELHFTKIGEKLKYEVRFKVTSAKLEDYVFGRIAWTDGVHVVTSPIALHTGTAGSNSKSAGAVSL